MYTYICLYTKRGMLVHRDKQSSLDTTTHTLFSLSLSVSFSRTHIHTHIQMHPPTHTRTHTHAMSRGGNFFDRWVISDQTD